jgi:hypothetical protein
MQGEFRCISSETRAGIKDVARRWLPLPLRGAKSQRPANGLGVNQEDTLQALTSQGNNTGSLYFSISHAWAGPIRFAAPEIDATSAASGLTLLLGGLVVLRGRRSIGMEEI